MIMHSVIKTKIINGDIKTKIINGDIKTKIVNRDIKTKILNSRQERPNLQQQKIISLLIPPELRTDLRSEIVVHGKKTLRVVSYLDNKTREIFLKKLINTGSYNSIFSFSRKKSHNIEPNLIIRISNKESSVENINTELQGIKTQYKLCSDKNNLGTIVDYGMLHNPTKNPTFRLQEYSIIEKYGVDLKKILENSPKYTNIGVVLQFMKDFLEDIAGIHRNNYAHLDLKPSNILMRNTKSAPTKSLSSIDYAIVDFGAARKFTSNTSRVIDEQMASAAFSPPELLQRRFGKKSDIWAYGVICYLVCVRKFFFKAKAQQIFMGENTKEIHRNITNAMDKLQQSVLPRLIKTTKAVNKYTYPLTTNSFHLLPDFFKQVFTIKSKDRPSAKELLQHPLFTQL